MAITNKQKEVWNIYFKSLTKAEKRVAIAKDVLLQIKLHRYLPSNTGYTQINYQTKFDYKDDIQSKFDKLDNCKVCALGSCILSITKFQNNLTVEDLDSGFQNEKSKVSKMLKSVFSPHQQALLERSFEFSHNHHSYYAYNIVLTNEEKAKCQKFYSSYINPTDRVTKAMNNIIDNKGTFIP